MEEINFTCISCQIAISASKDDIGALMQCPSCGSTMRVPAYGVIPGMKLGDFTVEKSLGVGGMGEVWLANQESMHRKVALKILSPEIADDKIFVKRFLQEVKIAGKLTHPNIVMAYHAGEQNGIRYLAISYVDGDVLGDLLTESNPIAEDEALRIVRDIAGALKYAWEKYRILHRDIKPDNIMISHDGTPMLMDMGISKIADNDDSLTLTGTVIGTPYYISPEQARAQPDLDSRTDQYSLGATLYHLLTGQLPYHATSAMGILAQHLQDPVPDCRKINPAISDGCHDLIGKMMEKSPEDRFSSWDEVLFSINQLLPPAMRETTILSGNLPQAPIKKSKAPKYILAALVLFLILAVFSLKKQLRRTKKEKKKLEGIQQLTDDSEILIPPEDKEYEKLRKPVVKSVDKPEKFMSKKEQNSIANQDSPRLENVKMEGHARRVRSSEVDSKGKDIIPAKDPETLMKETNVFESDKKKDPEAVLKHKLQKKFNLNDKDSDKLTEIFQQYRKALKKITSTAPDMRQGGKLRKIGEVRQLQHHTSKKAGSVLESGQIKEFKHFLINETMKLHQKRRRKFRRRPALPKK